jgi:hypothetical protein
VNDDKDNYQIEFGNYDDLENAEDEKYSNLDSDFPEILDGCDSCDNIEVKLYFDKLTGTRMCQNCKSRNSISKNKKRNRDDEYDY